MADGAQPESGTSDAGGAEPALDADGFLVEEPSVRTLARTESKLKQDATWTDLVAPRLGPELAEQVEQYNTEEAKTVAMDRVEAAEDLAKRHKAVDDVEKDVPVIAFATQQINRALSKKFGAKLNVAYTLPSEAKGIKPPSRDAEHPRPGDGAAEAQREGMLARRRRLKVRAVAGHACCNSTRGWGRAVPALAVSYAWAWRLWGRAATSVRLHCLTRMPCPPQRVCATWCHTGQDQCQEEARSGAAVLG